MKKTIAVAGGGSGWHIFPLKALIESFPSKDYKILWFGEKWKLEEKIAQQLKEQGYDIIFLPILAWKIRRQKDIKSWFLNLRDFFKNFIWFFQSLFYVCKYQPEIVFSKWGFVAFNPSLAGKICGKKVFLHESDTIPGLVNKIVGKFADKIFLWFKQAEKFFDNKKTIIVWQILSVGCQDDTFDDKSRWYLDDSKKHNIKVSTVSKLTNYDWLNLSEKTNLLVIGGSQGAKILIHTVKSLLDEWKLKDFNIFIVGGLLNQDNLFEEFSNVKFYPFIPQEKLFQLYQLADVSITRWSATSLAEQDYFNIKKIIVPLPYTGGNHQYFNGLAYEEKWDILLNQQDKDFKEKLLAILEKFKWRKKPSWVNKEVMSATSKILKVIWVK